jgi:hypothetical protein
MWYLWWLCQSTVKCLIAMLMFVSENIMNNTEKTLQFTVTWHVALDNTWPCTYSRMDKVFSDNYLGTVWCLNTCTSCLYHSVWKLCSNLTCQNVIGSQFWSTYCTQVELYVLILSGSILITCTSSKTISVKQLFYCHSYFWNCGISNLSFTKTKLISHLRNTGYGDLRIYTICLKYPCLVLSICMFACNDQLLMKTTLVCLLEWLL